MPVRIIGGCKPSLALAAARRTGYRIGVHMAGVAASGRIARLVLLACTLLGVAAMHTVGHGAVTHSPLRTVAVRSTIGSVVAVVTAARTSRDDCGGDGCAHPGAPPGDSRGRPWWQVCTGVLTGVAGAALLAGLLVALSTRPRSPSPPVDPRRPRSGAGGLFSFGLVVTVVAVARR